MPQEQAIRVTARGEFGQLQRGLKDLQGDLRNVLGEIDKGARKGGIFDDSSLRALDLYKKRFADTLEQLDREFQKQNDIVDKLYDKLNKGSYSQQENIKKEINARERELDVLRKQLYEAEKLYKKRGDEAGSYELKVPGSSGGGGSTDTGSSLVEGALSKTLGVLGNIFKFGLGLAGLGSIASLGYQSYNLAYQRATGSLDLAQRLRGYGFSGSAENMYDVATATGMRSNMGYTAPESWALLEAYSSRAGAITPQEQYGLQKFARGYGLEATQVGDITGSIRQMGGTTTPKQFADLISDSVSQSNMIPRILEVMQAHSELLQNLNTSFKDGASAQILAYQTTLDKIGNANGMMRLTGEQGANIVSGLGGIFTPSDDKWKWLGITALQQYNPEKYGKMGLYDLEANFEKGLLNTENIPAMVKYLRKESGGNESVFNRYMQSWLTEGGFNITKGQVQELSKVTNGFTVFDEDKISKVLGTDSGKKYEEERENEYGQQIKATEAAFQLALTGFGSQYLLPAVQSMKMGFIDVVNAIDNKEDAGSVIGKIGDFLGSTGIGPILGGLLGLKIVSSAFKSSGGGKGFFNDLFGSGEAPAASEATTAAESAAAGVENDIAGGLTGGQMQAIDEMTGGDPALKRVALDRYAKTKDLDDVASYLKSQKTIPKASGKELLDTGETKAASGWYGFKSFIYDTALTTVTADLTGKALTEAQQGQAEALKSHDRDKYMYNSTAISNITSGLSGTSGGSYNWGASIAYERNIKDADAQALLDLSKKGTLDLDGLSDTGKKRLEDLANAGMLQFTDLNRSSSTTLNSMSEDGKASLLKLQQDGSISIGGLQSDGTAKLTALNSDGKAALEELNREGKISISDFDRNGEVSISNLSKDGAEALLTLQKDGSGTLTTWSSDALGTLEQVRKDTAGKMDDIKTEHKSFLNSFQAFLLGIIKSLGIVNIPDSVMNLLTGTSSSSSTSNGDQLVGTSFFAGWQKRITQNYGDIYKGITHKGLDIAGSQGQGLDALANGTVSFIYMDNGGQFDTDKTANTRAGGTEIGIKMANGMTYTYSHLSQINPDVLMRYMGGENNIPISAGEYIGNIGGKPGVPGSGYSTTGSHLHLGMINSKGNKIDPESILSGLVDANGPIGVTHNFNVSVKLELTGEGADKLNSMTETQLKTFIKQTVEESAKENNSMNPTIRY